MCCTLHTTCYVGCTACVGQATNSPQPERRNGDLGRLDPPEDALVHKPLVNADECSRKDEWDLERERSTGSHQRTEIRPLHFQRQLRAKRSTSMPSAAPRGRSMWDRATRERAEWERGKTHLDAERSIDPELLRPPERTCSCFRPTSHPLRIHSPPHIVCSPA